jgi:hypothetical protein
MSSHFKLKWHTSLALALLTIALAVLLIEISVMIPAYLSHPLSDYGDYVGYGTFQRTSSDQCSFATTTYYPLPAILWVFTPLSLLPDWFMFVWKLMPFLIVLILYRKSGVFLWLFYPLLIQASLGQIEGWLLLPLYWLLENRRWLGGIGAVLLLFKPHIAIFAILYRLVFWLIKRDWRNLSAFAATMTTLYVPAFFICPSWLMIMLGQSSKRMGESMLPTRGATLWAWAWHGGITLWLLPIVAVAVAALATYVFVVRRKGAQTIQLVEALTMPVFYASSLVTVIPTLRTSRQFIILTIVSWIGLLLDTLAGGWGGVYVIIPIAALVLLALDQDATTANSTPQENTQQPAAPATHVTNP